MTILQTLRNSKLPPLDAELILSHVLTKTREYLFTHPEKKLTKPQISKFYGLAKRRLKGEPVAYLTGKKEFFGLEFLVDKNVLVPRPETELIVEEALKRFRIYDLGFTNVVDIGTGSGNIIISIARSLRRAKRNKINFYAVDISRKALNIAKKNAGKNKLEKSIKFIKSDLLGYFLKKKIGLENVLIVANLPYVSPEIYKKYRENLKFEPKRALISGDKGLRHYKRLIGEVRRICVARHALRATCFMEISPEQKDRLSRIVRKALPTAKIKVFKDISGKVRIAEISINGKN